MEKGRATDEEIENGIKWIAACFKRGPKSTCEVINFPTYVDELGYFYGASPIPSCVTREKTLAAIENCEEFLSFFHLPSLKVVSVGEGTGSDVDGLYSAINEYSLLSEEPQSLFRSMEVVLIYKNIKCQPFFLKQDQLLRDPDTDFGNTSQLMRSRNITTSFIRTDLKKIVC
ncbi:hypothetical protein AVEN_85522-1 [Araneus ventricosus]|uniref:Uncharacterized protein n=1 Tax=Araneus ventricosus TaxID=182803 RepID=A0A4Y2KZ21_ARAVE|nr:hypothetical protein AVEN_96629-1 [Araneus ventricosus]GBN07545.1 hypothetical protein AVEN_85522-1 [Araneus ventricosus]